MAFNVGGCPGAAGAGAGYPQYTVISAPQGTTGVVGKVGNSVAKSLVEATAWPNRVYFFTSQQAAQNCVNASGGAVSPALQSIASAGQTATNAATGIVAAGKGAPGAACLWNLNLPLVGSFCVLTKTEARAMIAGLILGVSGVVGIIGLGLIVVEGFASTGAGQAAGKTLERVGGSLALVPGAEAAGVLVAGAGSAARRGGPRAPQRRQQRAAADQGRAREIAREERQRAAKPPAKPATTPATSKPGQLTDAQRAELRARADQISTRQEPGR